MPKVLCLIGLVISGLIFLLFLIDIVFGLAGLTDMAPLRSASPALDILFILASAGIGYAAWSAFREQK